MAKKALTKSLNDYIFGVLLLKTKTLSFSHENIYRPLYSSEIILFHGPERNEGPHLILIRRLMNLAIGNCNIPSVVKSEPINKSWDSVVISKLSPNGFGML